MARPSLEGLFSDMSDKAVQDRFIYWLPVSITTECLSL